MLVAVFIFDGSNVRRPCYIKFQLRCENNEKKKMKIMEKKKITENKKDNNYHGKINKMHY